MHDAVPLKFTSAAVEDRVRTIIREHAKSGLVFEDLERAMNDRHFLVAPGSIDRTTIDIGADRYIESPSEQLDKRCFNYLEGWTSLSGMNWDLEGDELDAELRRRMGVDTPEEFREHMFELSRRDLPPAIKLELERLAQKRKVKRQLRVVK